jgi:Autotransporter beta-domain/Bacterial Ig domain
MNAFVRLLCAVLLVGFSLLSSAQDFNPVPLTTSFNPNGIVVTNNTVGLPVRFAFVGKVDGPSDFLLDSGVQTPVAGTVGNPVTQTLRFGTTSGVRIIQFCRDPSTTVTCNPLTQAGTNIIHYAYFSPRCTPVLTPNNTAVVAPTAVVIDAGCNFQAGAGATVENISYNWTVWGERTTPPPNNAATINLSVPVAGTYSVTAGYQANIRVTRGAPFNDTQPTAVFSTSGVTTNITATATLPTVSITSPANNATFTAPATIPFTANATAPEAIVSVEYLLSNGTSATSTTNTSPFSGSLTGVPAGTYTVTPRLRYCNNFECKAREIFDGTQSITITVFDPPTVVIASPANGATSIALSPMRLTATATSPRSPITKVEYFAGTIRIGQATAAPFEATWSPALPNAYSVTAVLTNQAGETATSPPITIKVNAPNPADVLCAVAVLPKSIKVGEAVTLQAVCKRNGILITAATLPSPESVSYEWRAGAASPPITTSTTGDTLVLSKTTFTRSGLFAYQVVAKLTNPQFPSASATSNTAEGIVEVKSAATRIDVITAPGSLRVLPGEAVNFSFRVLDGTNPVPSQEVKIAIIGGNVKRAASKAGLQKAFSNCAAQDVLAQQSVMTNNNGEGTVSFTAGCATGGRTVVLTAGDVQKSVGLNGPDQLAQKLSLLDGASLVSAEPNKPTAVSVKVIDSANAAVASSTTKWTIDPIAAGTVVATAVSNSEGIATTTLTLNTGFKSAQLEVCIDGSPSGTVDKCKKIQVRNSITSIVEPATAMTQATIQQAVDAPRVQLNNIRNRLQQLRVEEVGSGGAGGGSDKSGSGAGQNGSKLGVFALGEIDLAKRQSASGETTYKLRTKGVTVGADYRAQKNLVVGAAFGALLGDTTLTGGSQKTKGYSASVFGQWLPSDNWYVNSIVNVGTNRIDNRRTGISGETLSGRGTTTQQAFQVETGYGLSKDGVRFTPFVRYEMIRAKLKPFEESGGMEALAISGQTVRSNTFGLGAVAEYAISTSNGVWIPSGRVEFLSESQKQNAAFARLVNGTPVLAPLSVDAIDKSYGTWGLNLQWLTGTGGNLISSFIGYEQTFGKTGFKNDRFTAGVKIPF